MILAPDVWIVMECVIGYAHIGLFRRLLVTESDIDSPEEAKVCLLRRGLRILLW